MTTSPLPHLNGLSAEEFLRDYWQKKPLLVRNAFPELAAMLEPEDMIGLAQEKGVEARLVLEQGKTPWELRKGPFKERDFQKLPLTKWTLLVQAVDQYLPALADYLDHFRFVPHWRVDDVMVSYAVDGGSVGPHFDQYDVFLIQGSGQRHWQLGQICDEHSPRLAGTPLRILQDMETWFDEVLNPGDLLYVPPGLAHFGVAQGDCMTYSVGFRAPRLSHLLETVVDGMLEGDKGRLIADADRVPADHAGELTDADVERLRVQALSLLEDRGRLKEILARFLSEPKYEEYEPAGDEFTPAELQAHFAQGAELVRDPASRYVYTEDQGRFQLFVNGHTVDVPAELADLVRDLVDQRRWRGEALAAQLSPAALTWLCQQCAIGYWILEEPDDLY